MDSVKFPLLEIISAINKAMNRHQYDPNPVIIEDFCHCLPAIVSEFNMEFDKEIINLLQYVPDGSMICIRSVLGFCSPTSCKDCLNFQKNNLDVIWKVLSKQLKPTIISRSSVVPKVEPQITTRPARTINLPKLNGSINNINHHLQKEVVASVPKDNLIISNGVKYFDAGDSILYTPVSPRGKQGIPVVIQKLNYGQTDTIMQNTSHNPVRCTSPNPMQSQFIPNNFSRTKIQPNMSSNSDPFQQMLQKQHLEKLGNVDKKETSIEDPPSENLCRYRENCRKENCAFSHPRDIICRFGYMCTKDNCPYMHPPKIASEKNMTTPLFYPDNRYNNTNTPCFYPTNKYENANIAIKSPIMSIDDSLRSESNVPIANPKLVNDLIPKPNNQSKQNNQNNVKQPKNSNKNPNKNGKKYQGNPKSNGKANSKPNENNATKPWNKPNNVVAKPWALPSNDSTNSTNSSNNNSTNIVVTKPVETATI